MYDRLRRAGTPSMGRAGLPKDLDDPLLLEPFLRLPHRLSSFGRLKRLTHERRSDMCRVYR